LAVTNGYCTLADVKAALRIADTVDDALIENSINAASRMIDQYCNRYFYSTGAGEVRYFKALDAFNCWIDDCQSISQVKTAQSNPITYNQIWASTDFQTIPANTYANGAYQPITGLIAVYNYFFPTWQESNLVQVTGTWGWPSVPDPIKFATIIQASRLFKRLESPLGVAGVSDIGIIRVGSSVDGDVAQLCNPYRLLRTNA
jgi:hypothetical protein